MIDMSKKEIKKIAPTRNTKSDVKATVKGGNPKTPEQRKMTEEESLIQYMNNLISGTILDHEGIKTKMVENIKQLGQQLGLYMKALAKSEAEKKVLEEKLKKK